MNGLIMAAQMLLGLSILVVLHELGHFIAARAFGIKVEKFYLFFDAWGVKLFKTVKGGVEYGIGWLPLGGYVKIAGMVDESMDTEQLAAPAQPWEFRARPAWQRLIVMLGGIIVNIIVGILIFWMLSYKYGESYIANDSAVNGINPGVIGKDMGLQRGDKILAINGNKVVRFEEITGPNVLLNNTVLTVRRSDRTINVKVPENILNRVSDLGIAEFISPVPLVSTRIDSILPGSPAEKAGLKTGDVVTEVNSKAVRYDADARDAIVSSAGGIANLEVKRNGKDEVVKIPLDKDKKIGALFGINDIKATTINYSLFSALPVGVNMAWNTFSDNAKGIGKVLTGKVKANKAFSGPVEIARKVYGGQWIWKRFWASTAFISIALAFMNLLPIPALDGGHVLFLLAEMVKGKPLSQKFLERAQIAGFVLLVGLMVFVLGNDLFKVFTGK